MTPALMMDELDTFIRARYKALAPFMCSRGHLLEMCEKIKNGTIQGEKAHRWLGYIQGALITEGATTLEQMESMNKRCPTVKQDLPCEEPCPKCGAEGIHVSLRHGYGRQVVNEHISHRCGLCNYSWTGPVK